MILSGNALQLHYHRPVFSFQYGFSEKFLCFFANGDAFMTLSLTSLKKFELFLFLTAVMLLPGVSFGDTGVIRKPHSVIYTDNFALAEKAHSQDYSQSLRETLGSLNDYDVIPGKRNPHHLAFVKKNNGRSYVILDRIFVKCSRKTPCRLSEDPGAVRLSDRLWEVTVSDYDSWNTRVRELKEIPGVIRVSPAFFYGIKHEQR